MNTSTHEQRIEPPIRSKRGRRKLGDERPICAIEGCEKVSEARGWCTKHYRRYAYCGDPLLPIRKRVQHLICTVEGCENNQRASGYCNKHWLKWRKWGDPTATHRRGSGEGTVSSDGYRLVTRHGHPNAGPTGSILEHRLVMSEMIGRPLTRNESVHHINGDKLDNRPENLELWSTRHKDGQRVEDLVRFAREVLATYGDLYPE